MKFIAIILTSLLCIQANATTHIVSTIDDANEQLNKAVAGDTIVLKDGIYKDATIKFSNDHIAFIAEHAGKVFFENNSTLNFSGTYILVQGFVFQHGGAGLKSRQVVQFRTSEDNNASYSTVQDCVIDEYNNADKSTVNTWVGLYGQFNTVTRCLFKGKDNRGPTLVVWLDDKATPAHHTISYNYFLVRANGPGADNGLESMRIGDSKTSFTNANCVVAFNRFEDCDGEIEVISNKSCHNSFLHNSFINCDGGLTLRHGNNTLCDGNFFDGGDKKLSYGIRFIGEGHVAVNNYFYHLNGAPNQTFRAPITVLNGLSNTPINGYFQVKRAVITDNIFVDCSNPNIRIGAFSKRDGMVVAPDTVTIKNNIMFDDAGKVGNVFEEITPANKLIASQNLVMGNYLSVNTNGFEKVNAKGVKRNGFESITDSKGNIISSINRKAILIDNKGVGADIIPPSIANEVAKRKYTFLSAKEVGPLWMR
jgi:poly(beta-D-mannuronate) lyase